VHEVDLVGPPPPAGAEVHPVLAHEELGTDGERVRERTEVDVAVVGRRVGAGYGKSWGGHFDPPRTVNLGPLHDSLWVTP
jgi:hypothetical protein